MPLLAERGMASPGRSLPIHVPYSSDLVATPSLSHSPDDLFRGSGDRRVVKVSLIDGSHIRMHVYSTTLCAELVETIRKRLIRRRYHTAKDVHMSLARSAAASFMDCWLFDREGDTIPPNSNMYHLKILKDGVTFQSVQADEVILLKRHRSTFNGESLCISVAPLPDEADIGLSPSEQSRAARTIRMERVLSDESSIKCLSAHELRSQCFSDTDIQAPPTVPPPPTKKKKKKRRNGSTSSSKDTSPLTTPRSSDDEFGLGAGRSRSLSPESPVKIKGAYMRLRETSTRVPRSPRSLRTKSDASCHEKIIRLKFGSGDETSEADLSRRVKQLQDMEAALKKRIDRLEEREHACQVRYQSTSPRRTQRHKKGRKDDIDWRYATLGQLLGTGGSGNPVYMCFLENWTVAVKELCFEKANHRAVEAARTEAAVLRRLPKHPNVMSLLDVLETPYSMRLFLPLYNGTLRDFLEEMRANGDTLSVANVARIAHDIACGIQHLHIHSVIHRDLKAGNIFVRKGAMKAYLCEVALGDFDSSFICDMNSHPKSLIGTPAWIAPEMFACTANPELEYSFEVDTWSFGQVLFELCTCQTPYQDIDKDDLVETIQSGDFPAIDPAVASYYEPIVELHRQCLALDPKDRPSWTEIRCRLIELSSLSHELVAEGPRERKYSS